MHEHAQCNCHHGTSMHNAIAIMAQRGAHNQPVTVCLSEAALMLTTTVIYRLGLLLLGAVAGGTGSAGCGLAGGGITTCAVCALVTGSRQRLASIVEPAGLDHTVVGAGGVGAQGGVPVVTGCAGKAVLACVVEANLADVNRGLCGAPASINQALSLVLVAGGWCSSAPLVRGVHVGGQEVHLALATATRYSSSPYEFATHLQAAAMVHYIRDMQKCTVYSRHGSRHLVVMPGKHDCKAARRSNNPPAWPMYQMHSQQFKAHCANMCCIDTNTEQATYGEATRDGDSCVKPKPGGTRQPSLDTVPVSSVTTLVPQEVQLFLFQPSL